MEKFLHILEHSFIDSIKVLPILLFVYILIELIEYKHARKFENLKFLNRRYSSVFGALFGSLPQCGFSVVATDLFSKRKINIGTLIAVYIATSDEAIPIMFSNLKSLKALIPLIFLKIVIATLIGFISQVLFERFIEDKTKENHLNLSFNSSKTISEKANKHKDEKSQNYVIEHSHDEGLEHINSNHVHDHEEDDHEERLELHKGCCNHGIEDAKFNWHHPLFHSLKIFLSILIINILFGIIIEYGFKGEEKLAEFLTQNTVFWLQPLLAMIIGFIPNCASSVVLTELYLLDGLTFGALLAGLIVNAGLGLILLFKQNKNIKQNIFIILSLVVTSLAFGYLFHFIV